MNTLDAIKQRAGCRKYLDKALDREIIGAILDSGRYAPSAGNLQDRSFIVVKDPEKKKEISFACGKQTWMQTAPVLVIVLAENKKNEKFYGERGKIIYSIQDTAFAVENMLLAATELGIGSSLVVGFNEEKLIDILEIQEPAKPYAIVTLGYAAKPEKPSSKYPLDNFVFFEKHNERIDNFVAEFGDFEKVKEKIAEKTSAAAEGTKKNAADIFGKIKSKIASLFKKKQSEELIEDNFMEEKPRITEIKKEEKEEIPRQLSKK